MGMSTDGFDYVAQFVRDFSVRTGSCLQLGRQGMAFDYPTLIQIANRYGFLNGSSSAVEIPKSHPLTRVIQSGEVVAFDVKSGEKQRVSDIAAFSAIGFESVDSVDFTSDEGATLIYDLNVPGLDRFTPKRFDFILDSGTTEHVFDVTCLLANVASVLKPGGVVVHFNPMNNSADHGFYQVTPALYFGFYSANGFEILDGTVLAVEFTADDATLVPFQSYGTSAAHAHAVTFRGIGDPRHFELRFAARKDIHSTSDQLPAPFPRS